MEVRAILNIDVCSNETGEVLEQHENVWMGDAKKVYADIESRYASIVKIERNTWGFESRTVWVNE